jgi:hypothetical protein
MNATNNMPSDWNECLKEGDESFEYMLHHFYEMFDRNRIKHFDIRYTSNMTMEYYDNIREIYGDDIHTHVIPWIHRECYHGQLLKKENWKVYRDSYIYSHVFGISHIISISPLLFSVSNFGR